MKKNIFRIAALVLVGACMTACSSGDDEATNERVNPQENKDNIVTLTGKIAVPETTRSTVTEGGVSTWTAGDKIAVIYQNKFGSWSKAVGTISTGGSETSEFTVTLTNPVDCNAKLVYPADNATTSAPYYTTSTLSTQKGTLADIGTNHNIQSSEGDYALVISGESATLNGGTPVPLVNRVCITKFTLEYSNHSVFNASKLEVTGGGNTYTVTPDAKTNEFYIALPPMSGGITVTALGPQKFSTTTKLTEETSVTTDDYGKFIVVEPTSRQAYLASRESSNVWTKTFSGAELKAGEFYTQTLTFNGNIPVAVVAYVGSVSNYCTKFIALALEDVPTGGEVPLQYTGADAAAKNAALQNTINGFALSHSIRIGSTYDAINPSDGKYDLVPDNANTSGSPITFTNTSNIKASNSSSSLRQGWRIPSVTDFRYIFYQLKDDGASGSSLNVLSPSNPSGILDHNGVYKYETSTNVWNYKYTVEDQVYYKGSNNLVYYIRKLCGYPTDQGMYYLKGQYYWLGSQVSKYSTYETVESGKAWRYDFAHDFFEWNGATDTSLIRLVFAY